MHAHCYFSVFWTDRHSVNWTSFAASIAEAALGYDEGTVVIKLGSEVRALCFGCITFSLVRHCAAQEPVASMHSGKIIWVMLS